MEGKITQEKRGRDIATIKELNLSNCKSTNVVGLSEDWKNLEKLTLTNVGLTTLKGFPRLPNLKKLNLSDNKLCEGLDALACLPKLQELNLSSNKIKDLDALQPLKELKTLTNVSLFSCDVCKVENYRTKLFELIPSLKHLDGLEKGKKSEKGKKDEKNGGKVEVSNSEGEEDSLDEEEDIDEEVEEEEDEDTEDIPLEALYKKIRDQQAAAAAADDDDDEEDDEDFEADEEEEDEDIDEEDEDTSVNLSKSEALPEVRGKKRRHEDD